MRRKPVIWVGESQKTIRAFPEDVKREIGFAHQSQEGGKAISATPMVGFGGAGVLEIVADYRTDTYRSVYTVKFGDIVYVLHAFQKKSKSGISTPKKELDLIKARLRKAENHYRNSLNNAADKEEGI
ncbi:type II toxin-antitoxin system RelE/ParE family toxin [Stappia sediminis]|uniref:type II toxin-antitoxin system RelE/ParE family toxin n=1 Tax=Stappia sediminis TaxID=2692190 RepID=UPI001928F0E2|nr:type II toxin-antitoxin system RelE/ParE family toxin [Stappia sediminis]